MTKIAIVGAGISGLVLATQLKENADVIVFEKSRGVGGRLASRYLDDFEFDHGAQYFTVRSKEFKQFLKPYLDSKLVSNWEPKILTLSKTDDSYKRQWFEPHHVATPRMNSLCKEISKDIDIRLQTTVTAITNKESKWQLNTLNGVVEEKFDWVILSAPAPQTYSLMPDSFCNKELLKDIEIEPCYSLMLGFDKNFFLPFSAAVVKDSLVEWIAVNASKPMRNNKFCLVVQTNHQWTKDHLEEDIQNVQDMILDELYNNLGLNLEPYTNISLHKWRYAKTSKSLGHNYLIDTKQKLAAIGDWCLGARVECGFLSAYSLSQVFKRGDI